ncbi:hypothetical protein N7451_010406 [Penicillium sp. IBT 35674x]|nr:hypothetical protein N7451_010406 [Penicillium sp. IBT 35674x]
MNLCLITPGALITTRDQLDVEENLGSLYGRVITNIIMLDDDDDNDLTYPIQTLEMEVDNKSSNPPLDILDKL